MKIGYHFINLLLFLVLWPLILMARFHIKKIDVGIGPKPLINNIEWANALRKKGFVVETFVTSCHFITCEFDKRWHKEYYGLFKYLPTLIFLRNSFKYKIHYLYFNGGVLANLFLLGRLEPLLFKLAGSKTLVMPYGSDSQYLLFTKNKLMVDLISKDYRTHFKYFQSKTLSNVLMWSKQADFIVGSMDSIDYLPYWDELIPCHFTIDTAQNTLKISNSTNHNEKSQFTILHAFNHANVKGTFYIDQAIKVLVSEGYKIKYDRVEGLSNEEVKSKIIEADLVIDQLVMGWYGMFALEAMALSKPVICFLRDDLLELYEKKRLFNGGLPPIINANISNIKDVLKDSILNKTKLDDVGIRSREFVLKNNSYDVIGEFFYKINTHLIGS
jgi:glycosyltransferase involved in cell wall biosynthesis